MKLALQEYDNENTFFYIFSEATHERTGDKIIVHLKQVYFDKPYIQWGIANESMHGEFALGFAFLDKEEAMTHADIAANGYDLRYYKIDGRVKVVAIKVRNTQEMTVVQEI